MKKLRTLFSLAILTSVLLSCNSSLSIVSDYDVTADFKSYKTYMYLPWDKGNSEYITESAKANLYGMLDKELQARGYSKVEADADMAINLMVMLEEVREATAYTRYYSTGPVGYYSSFGYGYQSTTYYKKEDILEGTIVIDAFDQAQKSLIWQGIAILEIVENDAQRKRQVTTSIKKTFEKFPVE